MSHPEEITQFACGTTYLEQCSCPAVAAGYSPSPSTGNAIEPAEWFDAMAKELGHIDEHIGIIDDEAAEETWLKALDRLADEVAEGRASPKSLKTGIEIAQELGWL